MTGLDSGKAAKGGNNSSAMGMWCDYKGFEVPTTPLAMRATLYPTVRQLVGRCGHAPPLGDRVWESDLYRTPDKAIKRFERLARKIEDRIEQSLAESGSSMRHRSAQGHAAPTGRTTRQERFSRVEQTRGHEPASCKGVQDGPWRVKLTAEECLPPGSSGAVGPVQQRQQPRLNLTNPSSAMHLYIARMIAEGDLPELPQNWSLLAFSTPVPLLEGKVDAAVTGSAGATDARSSWALMWCSTCQRRVRHLNLIRHSGLAEPSAAECHIRRRIYDLNVEDSLDAHGASFAIHEAAGDEPRSRTVLCPRCCNPWRRDLLPRILQPKQDESNTCHTSSRCSNISVSHIESAIDELEARRQSDIREQRSSVAEEQQAVAAEQVGGKGPGTSGPVDLAQAQSTQRSEEQYNGTGPRRRDDILPISGTIASSASVLRGSPTSCNLQVGYHSLLWTQPAAHTAEPLPLRIFVRIPSVNQLKQFLLLAPLLSPLSLRLGSLFFVSGSRLRSNFLSALPALVPLRLAPKRRRFNPTAVAGLGGSGKLLLQEVVSVFSRAPPEMPLGAVRADLAGETEVPPPKEDATAPSLDSQARAVTNKCPGEICPDEGGPEQQKTEVRSSAPPVDNTIMEGETVVSGDAQSNLAIGPPSMLGRCQYESQGAVENGGSSARQGTASASTLEAKARPSVSQPCSAVMQSEPTVNKAAPNNAVAAVTEVTTQPVESASVPKEDTSLAPQTAGDNQGAVSSAGPPGEPPSFEGPGDEEKALRPVPREILRQEEEPMLHEQPGHSLTPLVPDPSSVDATTVAAVVGTELDLVQGPSAQSATLPACLVSRECAGDTERAASERVQSGVEASAVAECTDNVVDNSGEPAATLTVQNSRRQAGKTPTTTVERRGGGSPQFAEKKRRMGSAHWSEADAPLSTSRRQEAARVATAVRPEFTKLKSLNNVKTDRQALLDALRASRLESRPAAEVASSSIRGSEVDRRSAVGTTPGHRHNGSLSGSKKEHRDLDVKSRRGRR